MASWRAAKPACSARNGRLKLEELGERLLPSTVPIFTSTNRCYGNYRILVIESKHDNGSGPATFTAAFQDWESPGSTQVTGTVVYEGVWAGDRFFAGAYSEPQVSLTRASFRLRLVPFFPEFCGRCAVDIYHGLNCTEHLHPLRDVRR
jgi:hypothetical protein